MCDGMFVPAVRYEDGRIEERGQPSDEPAPDSSEELPNAGHVEELLRMALEDLLDRLDECVESGAIDRGSRVHRGMVNARDAMEGKNPWSEAELSERVRGWAVWRTYGGTPHRDPDWVRSGGQIVRWTETEAKRFVEDLNSRHPGAYEARRFDG